MGVDYFSVLALPKTFDINLKQLESAYFAAQRQCHPDRFVGKPEGERLAAMQRSVDFNQAYQTLKDPLTRAQHLLSLQGIIIGTEADSVKPSQALLVEIMELREELPDAKTIAQMLDESIARIGELFAASDWQSMAQEVLRLGYLVKIEQETKRKR